VASHRGVKGGYALRRPAAEVSLAELMESLDGGFHLAECTPTSNLCTLSAICPLKGAIADVHRRIRDVLRGVTLADVFRPHGEKGASVLGLDLVSPEKLLAAH
jgi:DNA-binding IscR family transcriptional regulator